MKNYSIKLTLLTILFIVTLPAQNKKTFYSAFDSISANSIEKHLSILADDSLEGRKVGTIGGNKAAEYISDQFSNYHLNIIVKENNYFQNIQMHGSIPLSSSALSLYLEEDTTYLALSEDYFLFRSGQQTFTPVSLPIVFVGYGIIAPEFDYNDYQSVNVEGKVVVFLDGEPYSDDEDYFDGNTPTIYSYPESKRRIAISRGAAGTIQIPISDFNNWKEVRKDFEFEDVALAYSVSSSLSVLLNPNSADYLFRNSEYSFSDVMKLHNENRLESFPLETKIKFRGIFKERDFISPNVIGMIEGSDPELKKTYLIISAHYDHLGIGKPVNGDSIYNGALDNAIGVSVLLELAKVFSELEIKPKRSILFLALTGEEFGLLGSSYYVDNPIVPLHKTIADINIDGIAMFKNFQSIVGIGSEYSTLYESLKQTVDRYDLSIENIPAQFRNFDAFNKSDQLAFAIAGIPSILILEGVKNKTKSEEEVLKAFINYYLEKYHTPFDEIKQDIDFEAAAKHAKILFDFCFHLANELNVPEWKSGSPFINARLRSISEEK